MKRWRDVAACSVRERREVLADALRAFPNRTLAARALGINRQYLYELLMAYGVPTKGSPDAPDTPVTPDSTVSPDTVGDPDSTDNRERPAPHTTVGVTQKDSLTYERHASTLTTTMSTAVATGETQETGGEPTVRVNLDFPKDVNDWLEREALRVKQETGASRAAKAPIVVELVRREMRRREDGGAR